MRTLLVLLFAVLASLGVVANWVASELLDDDRYVATMSNLAAAPAIQDAVAQAVTVRLVAGVLPGDAAEASTSSGRLSTANVTRAASIAIIDRVVRDVVHSDAFQSLWETANRIVHPRLVALLRGDTVAGVNVDDGRVVVDLAPLLTEVQVRLRDAGFPELLPTVAAEVPFVLFEASELATAQRAVDVLVTLRWLLPILALAAAIAGIWFSPARMRATSVMGLALAVGMALVLVALAVVRNRYVGDSDASLGRAATDAFLDIVTESLRGSLRGVALLGLLIAAGGWLSMPGNAWRAGIDAFVVKHRNLLYSAIAAFGALAIILQDQPSISSLVAIVLVAVAAAGLVWWVAHVAVVRGRPPAATGVSQGRP